MDLMGLCNICGKPDIMNTCILCGRIVCRNCYDPQNKVCCSCKSSKQ